ncbi:MAG: NAD-dependent epimerase/dehydratase family protein, partial [Desulfatiglandales bacterium]
DNLSTGKIENLNKGAKFYQADIRSQEIRAILERERPEVINHHAAQISVPDSVKDPIHDADVNIKGLLNLIECSKGYLKKFIFISSGGAIYGDAEEYPTTEAYQPKPMSPYAITKLCSEYYLNYYKHQFGLNFTVLRYSNIYGPRQIPHGEAGVVAIFMENILQNRPSTIYHFPGEEDGMVRDYCFVKDVAKANLLALQRGDGEILNIGTGRGTRTRELYDMIIEAYESLTGRAALELKSTFRGPAREGDIPKSCLVVRKAEEVLGWRPETQLLEGLKKTWGWRLGTESPQK